MALTPAGLTVDSFEEILDSIIFEEQANVSPQIEIDDDTSLGETNKIMAAQISLTNELLQDIYDQRSIENAEGKALDDNVSWLGIRRIAAVATTGTQHFVGVDGTTLSAGSFIQNVSTLENYTTDGSVSITSDACRDCTILVFEVDDNAYDYTISVKGIFSVYQSVALDTATEIIAGLVAQLLIDTDGSYTAVDNLDDTLTISVTDDADTAVTVDIKLKFSSVTVASNITGVNTGSLPAPANTVTTILSPQGGWVSTFNPNALIIGRAEETDEELRNRAISSSAAQGKATVDSIKAALFQISGVSSVAVNEQFVSQGAADTLIEVVIATDATQYDTTVNDTLFSIISGSSTTPITIAAQIVDNINTSPFLGDFTAVDNTDGTYRIVTTQIYNIIVTTDTNQSVTDGQPSGSIQVVIAGGSDNDEIAQVIWDTKGAGIEVWAVNGDTFNTGIAIDPFDEPHLIEFNRPTSILISVAVTYKVFDSTLYPEDDQTAFDAIKDNIVTFGNALGAGEDVKPSEFEGVVFCSVGGLYDVVVSMTSINGSASSVDPEATIPIATDEEAFFDTDNISVTNQT